MGDEVRNYPFPRIFQFSADGRCTPSPRRRKFVQFRKKVLPEKTRWREVIFGAAKRPENDLRRWGLLVILRSLRPLFFFEPLRSPGTYGFLKNHLKKNRKISVGEKWLEMVGFFEAFSPLKNHSKTGGCRVAKTGFWVGVVGCAIDI
jgi:hypothetical protein